LISVSFFENKKRINIKSRGDNYLSINIREYKKKGILLLLSEIVFYMFSKLKKSKTIRFNNLAIIFVALMRLLSTKKAS